MILDGVRSCSFCLWSSLVPILEVSVSSCDNWNSISPYVTNLTINQGICNDVSSSLSLSGFVLLRKLIVKKNSMKKLSLFSIDNNVRLESITIEGGNEYYGAFYEIGRLCLTSLIHLFNSSDLPALTTVSVGAYACYRTSKFELTSWFDLIQFIGSSSFNNTHYRIIFILEWEFV